MMKQYTNETAEEREGTFGPFTVTYLTCALPQEERKEFNTIRALQSRRSSSGSGRSSARPQAPAAVGATWCLLLRGALPPLHPGTHASPSPLHPIRRHTHSAEGRSGWLRLRCHPLPSELSLIIDPVQPRAVPYQMLHRGKPDDHIWPPDIAHAEKIDP